MDIYYYPSRDIDEPLRVKINHIEDSRQKYGYSSLYKDPAKSLSFKGPYLVNLCVSVQVFSEGRPLTIPVYTKSKPHQPVARWNEWLELPIPVRGLPLSASLVITIWGPSGNSELAVYGGTNVSLFSNTDRLMLKGRQKLYVWPDAPGDPQPTTSTPSKLHETPGEPDRLENLLKKHQMGEISSIEWLDNLVFREIEQISRTALRKELGRHNLYIDLPLYSHDVVHLEVLYDVEQPLCVSNTQQLSTPIPLFEDQESTFINTVYDPDVERDTPIDTKYRRLLRSAAHDRDLRPNAKVRDELQSILAFSPVREMTSDEKNLIWTFRFYLTRYKHALTKFIKSVTWEDQSEAAQAVEVLHLWVGIDVAAALELLGPEIGDSTVRAYAVDRLRTASDHDLELYLLQLVEALKFEQWQVSAAKSHLAKFLISRAVLNPALGNFFYWYVSVQTHERRFGAQVYQPILRHYLTALPQIPGGDHQILQIKFQVKFMNKLLELAKLVKQAKEPRIKRIQILQEYIADPRNELLSFLPTSLPIDPAVVVVGCIPEECSIFKSSMQPLKISLRVQGGGTYRLIFKSGDDLRQDQLVMQIILLMDQLLRHENLDLRLTPYRILATSPVDGAIQFVPNDTLAHILSEHHGILPFLRVHNADLSQPLGVSEKAMNNFVRSSAGYAVITYLLGVGDRHLDNLLIDFSGKFFHIDFGYILGQDPKPFPPMIKLPIQLIDGMGGINSDNYKSFCSYCFTAFTTLRRSANLILALFNLMTESTIPNIMMEREQAIHKVEERFCLNMSEEEAILHFQNLINDSVNAFLPMVIDRLHSMAQYWRA